MKKYYKLIRILLHILKALIFLAIYFPPKKMQLQALTEDEKKLICQWFQKLLLILNIKVVSSNLVTSSLTKLSSPIVVANHISWLDIVVLGSLFPIRFVAKSEISTWPILNILVKKTGTLFIRRGRSSGLKSASNEIAKLINNQENILFFPEGKTSDGKQIGKFFPGLFQVAIDSHINVRTLLLSYRDECEPSIAVPYIDDDNLLQSLWRIIKQNKIEASVLHCPLIDVKNKDRKMLAQEAEKLLSQALKSKLTTTS